MSEHSASTMTLPAPEKDPAAPIEQTEQEPAGSEKSLIESAKEIRALDPTVGSFRKLLGDTYADLLPANADDDAELGEVAKNVFEYEKSRLYASLADEIVDGDVFKRETVAFPENPKAGKTAYIIDDLKTAISETTDPTFKKNLEDSLLHMENFAKIVSEDDNNRDDTFLKRYLELANDPKADPEELKAAKESLVALQEGNLVKFGAYKVIALYFPSEKTKQHLELTNTRVSLRPDKELGVEPTQQAANTELASQKAERLEKAEYELSIFRDSDKKGETGVAVEIAKRANSRGTLTKKPNQQTKLKQRLYADKNYEVFALRHIGDNEDRFNKLAKYVTAEAIGLQASVRNKLATQRDLQVMPDLTKAIKEAREEIEAENTYDELKVYAKLQSAVLDGFEKFILGDQSTDTKRSIGRKALSVTSNGLVKGLDGLIYVMADKPWELVDKGRDAAKKRLNTKRQSDKKEQSASPASDEKNTEEEISSSRKLRHKVQTKAHDLKESERVKKIQGKVNEKLNASERVKKIRKIHKKLAEVAANNALRH